MSRVKRRLTAVEFATVRPTLRLMHISERRIEAAYSAMVDGKPLAAIADDYGWSAQAVSKTVRRVWEIHLMLADKESG